MSKKKILSVNCEIPGGNCRCVFLDSDSSSLDWDIIVFLPEIKQFAFCVESYLGKPSLSESASFQVREQNGHWSRELREALEAGKTIFVILDEIKDGYIDTGEKQYSGTGRNRQTTRLVSLINSYSSLPLTHGAINSKGVEIKLAKDASLIASYWAEFGKESQYRVRLGEKCGVPLLLTRTGEKTVGAIIKREHGPGAIILLPFIDLADRRFIQEGKDGKQFWNSEAVKFGNRFISAIVEIDRSIQGFGSNSPAPEWSKDSRYNSAKEISLRQEILKIDSKVEDLLGKKSRLVEQMEAEGSLRDLLFENGLRLENSIIRALKILGFSAENYEEGDSEFDVVFSSKEGRLLGEAEGKDTKAIAIEKLRQLEMNINEDFERPDVDVHAKAVLFGNAYRLLPPEERGDFFTDKCLTSAQRSGTALVKTTDLFLVAQHLSAVNDAPFAKRCRMAILSTHGAVVEFPKPPKRKPTLIASEKKKVYPEDV